MANTHYHGAHAASAHGVSGNASLLGRIQQFFSNLAAHRRLSAAERELNGFDNRMLDDIGVARTEIHQRVWGGRARG